MTKKKGILKAMFGMAAAAAIAAPLVFSSAAMAQDDTNAAAPAPVMEAQKQGDGDTLTYLYPLALLGFGSLPLLWWLLRVTPPKPEVHDFPPVRIIGEPKQDEETPAKTPLWQMLMRMTAASAFVLAMAQPVFNPDDPLGGDGPLMLVVDNGWGAGPHWKERQEEMANLIDRAGREGRQVIILTTAATRRN